MIFIVNIKQWRLSRVVNFGLKSFGPSVSSKQVDLYCQWLLETSIERHFKLLAQGRGTQQTDQQTDQRDPASNMTIVGT